MLYQKLLELSRQYLPLVMPPEDGDTELLTFVGGRAANSIPLIPCECEHSSMFTILSVPVCGGCGEYKTQQTDDCKTTGAELNQ